MEISKIQSLKDLDDLSDNIRKQGFGHIDTYKLHTNKIQSIKTKANKLNIDDRKNIDNLFNNKDLYDDIENKLNDYYSKFNNDDKIKELLNSFYIMSDSTGITPSRNSTKNEIIEWYDFKTKHNIDLETELNFGTSTYVSYYDLDKSYLKLNYNKKYYEFNDLYFLLYDKTPIEELKYSENSSVWKNLGEIEIKLFLNNSMNVKGNITKLKNYFYNDLINTKNMSKIIKYNKKIDIITEK